MSVLDGHVSGFYDATDEQWSALMATVTDLVDVAGVTEAQRLRQRHLPPRWGLWDPRGGEAECSVVWDADVFEPARWKSNGRRMAGKQSLTDQPFKTGAGAVRKGVAATWACLDRRTGGRRLLRVVVHFNSGVQDGAKWSGLRPRVVAWGAALVGLVKLLRALKRTTGCDDIVVSFDTNIDLDELVWRMQLAPALATVGLRLVVPPKPTHAGARTIDAWATNMRPIKSAFVVLERFRGFDHLPIVGEFVERARRWWGRKQKPRP